MLLTATAPPSALGDDSGAAGHLTAPLSAVTASPGVMETLAGVAAPRGPDGLSERLRRLGELTRDDLVDCEAALAAIPHGPSHVSRSASHLLALGGKRLRPLCVALASRAGSGFNH